MNLKFRRTLKESQRCFLGFRIISKVRYRCVKGSSIGYQRLSLILQGVPRRYRWLQGRFLRVLEGLRCVSKGHSGGFKNASGALGGFKDVSKEFQVTPGAYEGFGGISKCFRGFSVGIKNDAAQVTV